jgi:hypothetical protein
MLIARSTAACAEQARCAVNHHAALRPSSSTAGGDFPLATWLNTTGQSTEALISVSRSSDDAVRQHGIATCFAKRYHARLISSASVASVRATTKRSPVR